MAVAPENSHEPPRSFDIHKGLVNINRARIKKVPEINKKRARIKKAKKEKSNPNS